jgi:hypothetical protein
VRRSLPRKSEKSKKEAKPSVKKLKKAKVDTMEPFISKAPAKLVIKQHIGRLLLPELFIIAIVSAIFYGLILLNLSFLDVILPEDIYLFVLFILCSLIVLQLLLIFHRREVYVFYEDRIDFEPTKDWELFYDDIFDMKLSKDFFDKAFATGTLTINVNHKLKHIHRPERIKEVIQHVKD